MRINSHSFLILAAVCLAPLGHAETAIAQEQNFDLSQLRQLVEKQGTQLKEQQRQIEDLRTRAGADDKALEIRGGQGESGQDQRQPPAVETKGKKKAVGKEAAQPEEQLPAQPVGRPPAKPPVSKQYKEIEAIFRQQGVLTPKRTLVIEPSFQYAFSSSNQVVLSGYTVIPALTIGLINTQRVERNTYIAALSARYGLTNRLELNVYVPYVYRDDSTVFTPLNVPNQTQQIFNARGHNLGDVQFGLRCQFNMPTSGGPILIGGLTAKSATGKDPFSVTTDPVTGISKNLPTGTGFWGLQPSLSLIFPSDPVVFFGSVNYLYQFQDNYPIGGVLTDIEPGGTFGFNFGIGFSLNEKTSLSIGYEHYIILPTDIHNTSVVIAPIATQSTTLGSLVFGAAYRLSDRVSINFSLEAGITQDAPDIVLTLRVPFSI
jgi:hypothetical protein